MDEQPKRPLLKFVRGADHVVNFVALLLVLLLATYAGYSIWYSNSLLNGAFLSDDLAQFKPDGHEPTLEELMALNGDVRAWLTVDETHIDYPVVQGETDQEYLNRSVDGDFSLAGAIFLSSLNSADFSDPYNIVYGHHVEGGAMFADVLEFCDKQFFDEHTTGILWLADTAYRIELFACIEVDGRDSVVYQDPSLVTPDLLPGLVDDVLSRSVQKRAVSIAPGDSVIALSTCEDATTFSRAVLFGKLVPMTEEEIRAAEAANYASTQEAQAQGGAQGAPSLLDSEPWLLPTAGALLLVLVLLLVRRAFRR